MGGRKLDLEKFLIFNQQFVTLFRAGLPILEVSRPARPSDSPTSALSPHTSSEIRDDVKKGSSAVGRLPRARASSRRSMSPP
ncbi:MAG: hypothetical protein MZV70_19360 [Desulfobacterales bacterium]|nr:hypothetical protein [Desulfobacterales bacterium]